ncbi:MAG: hypothetical protein QXZ38_03710 [Candidatus Micrarchaeaceae archaeon]
MPLGVDGRVKHLRAQAASEYLIVYAAAMLFITILMVLFYFFVIAPSAIPPNSCSFITGAYCQDMVFGSNSAYSSVGLFLTNTQPYPIVNPSIMLNISSIGQLQGTCKPNLVAAGGVIICNVTIPQRAIAYGTLESGELYLSAVPCPSGNAAACSTTPRQTYLGNFDSHVSPLLSSTSATVSLTVENATQAANGVPDKLVANVKMLGYPVAGATVTFKANQSFATIKTTPATTDSNGTAVVYISSLTVGKVLVNATFAGVSASQVINFTQPVYVTFQTTPMPGALATVASFDNTQFTYPQLPVTFSYTRNSVHNYAFDSAVTGPSGTRYVYLSVSGCGLTAQSGSFVATGNCTVTANYRTQYFLSMQAEPQEANIQLIPGSGWFYSGSQVAISAIAPGYKFKGWVGAGYGNYTGTNSQANVVMNGPISETASVERVTTTTISVTSTTSTAPPKVTIAPTTTIQSGCSVYSKPPLRLGVNWYSLFQSTMQIGSIKGSLLNYILTPGGSYNNLNTYYYYNITPISVGPMSAGKTYEFHIDAESMGGAAWFNNPVWFALGTSTSPSVGLLIDYDPCVASYHPGANPQFGIVKGTRIIYPEPNGTVYSSQSQIAASGFSGYEARSNTNYTVEFTINSPTSVTIDVVGVFIYTVNNNAEPLNLSNVYIYGGGNYDQGNGGGSDNSASSPEGSFGTAR